MIALDTSVEVNENEQPALPTDESGFPYNTLSSYASEESLDLDAMFYPLGSEGQPDAVECHTGTGGSGSGSGGGHVNGTAVGGGAAKGTNTGASYVETGKPDGQRPRKRRRDKDGLLSVEFDPYGLIQKLDPSLFKSTFPAEFESDFLCAAFELGLKYSSPKVLMTLMPDHEGLNTEHIKSHLQKYRIHHERSKEEFLEFFNKCMLDSFREWEGSRAWEHMPSLGSHGNGAASGSGTGSASGASAKRKGAEKDTSKTNNMEAIHQHAKAVKNAKAEKKAKQANTKKLCVLSEADALLNEWRTLFDENIIELDKARYQFRDGPDTAAHSAHAGGAAGMKDGDMLSHDMSMFQK